MLKEQPGRFSIARLPERAGLPEWFPGDGPRFAAWGEGELSLVVPQESVPNGVEASRGWAMVQVTTLADLDEPGVVLAAVRPISEAGLGVFVTSTFLRDYILVRADDLSKACVLWALNGHEVQVEDRSVLRCATEQDVPTLAAVHAAAGAPVYDGLIPANARHLLEEPHRRKQWQAHFDTRAGPVFALEADGDLQGFVSLRPSQIQGFENGMELHRLYIAPKAQGKGCGVRLMKTAMACARLSGADTLFLAVVDGNSAAQAFYARRGGQDVGGFTDPGPLWPSQNRIIRFDLGNKK